LQPTGALFVLNSKTDPLLHVVSTGRSYFPWLSVWYAGGSAGGSQLLASPTGSKCVRLLSACPALTALSSQPGHAAPRPGLRMSQCGVRLSHGRLAAPVPPRGGYQKRWQFFSGADPGTNLAQNRPGRAQARRANCRWAPHAASPTRQYRAWDFG
jgi:hypothetical protein